MKKRKASRLNQSKPSLISLFLFALIISYCIERIYSISSYSIVKASPDINSLKASSAFVPIMGAEEFMTKSNSLFKDRINLHMWHGNQHLLFKFDKELSFYVELNNQGKVDLIFKESSIRLELGKKITIRRDSLIENFKEFDSSIKEKLKVVIKDKSLFIDDLKILSGIVGDNIGIRSIGLGKATLSKIFIDENHISLRPPLSLPIFLVFGTLCFLGLFFLGPLKGAMVGLVLTIISLACYLSYIYSFQELYSFKMFGTESQDQILIEKEKRRVKKILKENNSSVLFIGSSQTYGEGASSKKTRWTEIYCTQLKITHCLNIGIRSAVSQNFVELKDEIAQSRPQKIFFVLSHNDSDNVAHKTNVDILFKEWLELGIEVIVVLEPNVFALEELSPLHYNLLKLAWKYGYKVINPIDAFKKVKGLGGIWWDEVHLTDKGHKIMAEQLMFPEE